MSDWDIFRREVTYLGQVGAIYHLTELADAMHVRVDRRPPPWPERRPQGREVKYLKDSAFGWYEEALQNAKKAARSASKTGFGPLYTGHLRNALAEAYAMRARLFAKPADIRGRRVPAPGRHGWNDPGGAA